MRPMPKTIVVALAAAIVCGSIPLDAQAIDRELRQAIDEREAAFETRDLDRWSRYTADDYLLTTEAGTVRTKADQLASMRRNPASPAKRGSRREEAVHRYGDTVIFGLLVDSQAGPRREMHVWVKEAGHWKVAAVQVTLVARP